MEIALIVAAASNGVIGINNTLPWHLPEDMKHFRQVTMGKAIIMGRKTFVSIGKALPGRTSIVLSQASDLDLPKGVLLANNVEQALHYAKQVCQDKGHTEAMVIGGEQIYNLFMPYANRLYLTEVKANIDGDAYFYYKKEDWQLVSEEAHRATEANPYDYRFCVLEKQAIVE